MAKNIKYVILVGDGMGDFPMDELRGETPLEVANTPNMDRVAQGGIGLVNTIPPGMEPGSDVATMSLLGYDPASYHTGRAPLEAASMNLRLSDGHVAFRMNLVTLLRRSDSEIIMESYNSGEISREEGTAIVKDLGLALERPGIKLFPGVAYRHILLWDKGPEEAHTIPPHDVLGQNVASYLSDPGNRQVSGVIKASWPILETHPINLERRKKGLLEANSIWLWGQGKAPRMPSFQELFGLVGGVVSAVDLLKGIGRYAGLETPEVEGATGYIDTNYEGKVEAALDILKGADFVLLHLEAPDEAGHRGDLNGKIEAIEAFDQKIVGPILEGLKDHQNYRVMVVSDHLTPIVKRTHTNDPTPFAWAWKHELEGQATQGGDLGFSERAAKGSGLFFQAGNHLMPEFLAKSSA